jgi:hypothetical protein
MNTWIIIAIIAGVAWWGYTRYLKSKRDRDKEDKSELEE